MFNFCYFLSIRNDNDSYLFYSSYLVLKYILVKSNVFGMPVPREMIFGKAISDHEDQATKGRSNAQLWSPLPQEA